jgi:hypothetical protein
MHYPEFGHIGFKLLCAAYGYFSFQHMQVTAVQREQQRQEMARIANTLEALKSQRK